jgi:hypothetical protein
MLNITTVFLAMNILNSLFNHQYLTYGLHHLAYLQ